MVAFQDELVDDGFEEVREGCIVKAWHAASYSRTVLLPYVGLEKWVAVMSNSAASKSIARLEASPWNGGRRSLDVSHSADRSMSLSTASQALRRTADARDACSISHRFYGHELKQRVPDALLELVEGDELDPLQESLHHFIRVLDIAAGRSIICRLSTCLSEGACNEMLANV